MLTSRAFRRRYNIPLSFFRADGHVVFFDLSSARAFADRISALRQEPISASDLYALSLLDEVYRLLLKHFAGRYTGIIARAMGALQSSLGSRYDLTLTKFTEEFPPLPVYLGETTAGLYLATTVPAYGDFGRGVRAAAIEEMLVVYTFNRNPAASRYKDLFDESALNGSAYADFMRILLDFFAKQPGFGNSETSQGETLDQILLAPIRAAPDSLEGQLKFILERWGHFLGEEFALRILRALDFLREEVVRKRGAADTFSAEAHVPVYSDAEYERYSPDQEWMPRLVLMAKNAYVWLDQLSKKYQREIRTLDQIPDEELTLLAARGFTGLWLIGLWERSRASKKIKQRMGQPGAAASAYSLYSYDIAADLGGWAALDTLRARAWQKGIRLSADMVPNHMGIDSNWVIEHPDWFLSIDYPPYPSYTFNSENLSDDPRAAIVLEDHYYDCSDAAVVFKLHHYRENRTRYVYHGNDGTSFPWNDTAQLDYSKAEVREAVMQVILHVARNFPIIRFDAAMTLAKRHIQRLWFPEPGAGGAIPSRAQFGMTKAEFDEKIPNEFWREVVDRVAAELPDTLLLAEAFWLMEGYFVRTLGMHRVYNSAFMHMLRDEDNAKYRMAIKNTLEFDPQILKRYVNFMNNPDEKTAVEQFGKGDKYFGVCTLLSTLPGLPMFGHGQIEGFAEKYGMEFRRAQWEETPDENLIQAHEWRIFPLLHRRFLFADVENFLLYDFLQPYGGVDENVFAYSNRFNDERGLVVYHNKFSDTRGWVKTSAAYLDKRTGKLIRRELAEGIGLPKSGCVIFKDYVTQLEYIHSCREIWEKGLYVELGAYQCHAFMDFRFVSGKDWQTVHDQLGGAGVPSIQAEWRKLFAEESEAAREKEPSKTKRASKTKKAAVKPAAKKRLTGAASRKKTKTNTRVPSPKKKPARSGAQVPLASQSAEKKKARSKESRRKKKVKGV